MPQKEHVPSAELRRRLGLSQHDFKELVEKGIFRADHRNKQLFDVFANERSYQDYLEKGSEGETLTEKAMRAKLELFIMRSEKAKMDLAREKGELVVLKDARRVSDAFIKQVVSHLVSIPDKFVAHAMSIMPGSEKEKVEKTLRFISEALIAGIRQVDFDDLYRGNDEERAPEEEETEELVKEESGVWNL